MRSRMIIFNPRAFSNWRWEFGYYKIPPSRHNNLTIIQTNKHRLSVIPYIIYTDI